MKPNLRKKALTGAVALLIVAIFTALCIIPATAGMHASAPSRQAKRMDGPKHHRSPLNIWRNPQLIQELELSDDQVAQLRDADFAAREKQLKLKAALDTSRLQMDKAFSQKSIDDKSVRQLAEKMADIKGGLFIRKIESRLAVTKILNADQINKLKLHKMEQRKKKTHRGRRAVSDSKPLAPSQDESLSLAISE